MTQDIIVIVLFVVALAYVGRLIWRQFSAKDATGCAKGCSGCNVIDVDKIEAGFRQKSIR
jgi:hypothetical protein